VPSFLLKKTLEFDIDKLSIPLAPASVLDSYNNSIRISVKKQQDFIDNAHRINKPYRILIFSTSDILLAQMLMLRIYTKTAKKILKSDFSNFMEWYIPDEQFNENSEHKSHPYMVIDGIRCVPNQAKTSKVKNLLMTYPNPMFILISGKLPYKFWLEEYNTKPNFVVRVDRANMNKATNFRI
jgi:hypothetical protein